LLLRAGGFSAIVLDMGSIAPEHASRIPLATWFRYRAAAERAQASILLLTQTSCAKSSAELLLRFEPAKAIPSEPTVFTGFEVSVEIARRRFSEDTNITPFRKPPQTAHSTRPTTHCPTPPACAGHASDIQTNTPASPRMSCPCRHGCAFSPRSAQYPV